MIIWWIIKLLLVLIPYHFYQEYKLEALFIESAQNLKPAEAVYWVPIASQGKPEVIVKVYYPKVVIVGRQYIIRYEIENFNEQKDLYFDLGLKTGNTALSVPILFGHGNPVQSDSGFILTKASTIGIEFEPQVRVEKQKFTYNVRQIPVYEESYFAQENFWKWADLVLLIITGILWLVLLVSL